jgi:hypothetical protein
VHISYFIKAFEPILHKKLLFCKTFIFHDVAGEYFVMAFCALCTSLSKLYKTKNFVHRQFAINLKFDFEATQAIFASPSLPPPPMRPNFHYFREHFLLTVVLL